MAGPPLNWPVRLAMLARLMMGPATAHELDRQCGAAAGVAYHILLAWERRGWVRRHARKYPHMWTLNVHQTPVCRTGKFGAESEGPNTQSENLSPLRAMENTVNASRGVRG